MILPLPPHHSTFQIWFTPPDGRRSFIWLFHMSGRVIICCLPRHIGKELDQKGSSQDSNLSE